MTGRLAFITKEYRLATADTNLPAQYNGRSLELNTNLTFAGAQIRLAEEVAAGGLTRILEATVREIYLPDSFKDGPPRVIVYDEGLGINGEVFRAYQAQAKIKQGYTILRLRK